MRKLHPDIKSSLCNQMHDRPFFSQRSTLKLANIIKFTTHKYVYSFYGVLNSISHHKTKVIFHIYGDVLVWSQNICDMFCIPKNDHMLNIVGSSLPHCILPYESWLNRFWFTTPSSVSSICFFPFSVKMKINSDSLESQVINR